MTVTVASVMKILSFLLILLVLGKIVTSWVVPLTADGLSPSSPRRRPWAELR